MDDPVLSVVIATIGLLVVALTVWDIAGSLLGDEGDGGMVTGRITRMVWRSLEPSRRRGHHLPSHIAGRAMVLTIPLTWLVSMWAGWSLVVTSSTGNVVASSSGAAATVTEKLYFVGYLLATLGNGEFQPTGTGWQATSVVVTVAGFSVLTLGVTFVVPVVQAATTRRETAATIALHGVTSAELHESLEAGRVDEATLARQIVTLAEKHGAFPVLHFLHTREAERSAPAMIARLAIAAESVDVDPALQRALTRYRRFHPGMADDPETDVWADALRSDGRTVPDGH